MTDFPISSQVSWVDYYKDQKLYFSNAMEKVRIHSGDGFTFHLPTHALLASSRLVQRIFPCWEEGQDISLPSVSGRTILPLVELLRCGVTTITGSIGNMKMDSIKEIQEVMKMLGIEGIVTIMKNGDSSRRSKKCEMRRLNSADQYLTSNVQVLMGVSPRHEQSPENCQSHADQDHDIGDQEEFEINDAEICEDKKMIQHDCHICGWKSYNKGTWRAHMRNSHEDALFPCTYCGKKFTFEHSMKFHVEAAHTGSVKCDYCQKGCRNTETLRKHIRKLHRDKMIRCTYCSHCFVNKETFTYHMKYFHPEAKGPVVCEECRLTFKKRKNLLNHVKNVHSGPRHVCPECRETFSTRNNLLRHAKNNVCNNKVVEIPEPYEHNGDSTMDVATNDKHTDKDSNMVAMKQEMNISEEQ